MNKPKNIDGIVAKHSVEETAKEVRPQKQPRKLLPVFLALLVGLAIGAGGLYGAYKLLTKPEPPVIPVEYSQKVNFSIIAPSPSNGYSLDTFGYDATSGVLSFTARGPEANFLFTEQATPSNFTEIPEYFDKLVESLLEYKRFDTEIGRVSLTKPKEFNGQQAAVLNTKGTLLFVRPDKELDDETWRQFFNRIQTIK